MGRIVLEKWFETLKQAEDITECSFSVVLSLNFWFILYWLDYFTTVYE